MITSLRTARLQLQRPISRFRPIFSSAESSCASHFSREPFHFYTPKQLRARRAYSTSHPPPPPPPPPPRRRSSPLRVWPFIFITLAGSSSYILLVRARADPMSAPDPNAPSLPSPSKPHPTFSPEDVTVVFVLGGPGSGKGTQCAKLVSDYGFTHLSAGDLLREEQDRPGSEFGELIRNNIKEGIIVPMEVTVSLLENAMTETLEHKGDGVGREKGRFLIDGFPRKMDQALHFEASVCPSRLTLFFDCPEDVMLTRLLDRGKTSGRSDDNIDSIKKRFRVFVDTSMPVVEHFDHESKVIKVDATKSPDDVYAVVKEGLGKRLGL
ncbi:MAG: bifunctional uridylate/adenylate kinase [Sclerophora amabilis]|nr:MAG: bifunctional uridylate/adenylate kinase [Sclerophora amabilis]